MTEVRRRPTRKRVAAATSATALAASALTAGLFGLGTGPASAGETTGSTATPIKHVVVIFQENVRKLRLHRKKIVKIWRKDQIRY